MKLTIVILILSLLQVSTKVYSQVTKFNLKAEDKQIVEVLKEIEESSKFRFFYIREQVNVERRVSIKTNKATIEDILDELFKGQGIKYQIMEDFLILLSPENITYEKAINNRQKNSVAGVITDEFGQPLAGATIYIKGTSQGTVSNSFGNYSISNILEDDILVFSFVGMSTQEIAVAGRSQINITMKINEIGIEEVVAVGYGVQRKIDVTGSVGKVDANVILEGHAFNALQGIKGKIAGVNIFSNSGSPTGSTRVIIRGMNSIETTSDPLYVVDGVVMENFQLLNPNDIEHIDVLKDASSAAIYGARGANGVILVTTKRGAKNGEVIVSYNSYISVGRIRKKMDLLNAEEWLKVIKRGYENAPKYSSYDAGSLPTINFTDPNLFDANGKPLYDTDWQDEATRTAISHNHQFSIQQGNEKSSVGAFLNFTDIKGIMLNSWLKRANTKIAYDAKPKEWLDFGINMLINKTWENEIDEGSGYQMPRRTMIEFVPIFPVKFPDGSWSNSSSTNNFALEGMANPVHVLTTQKRLRNRTQFFGNIFLNFHIHPGLDLKTQFGLDNHIAEYKEYSPKDLLNISYPNGSADINNSESMYWQEETFLTYNKSIKGNRINSIVGLSWQERISRFNTMNTSGFSDDFYKYNNMSAASDPGALLSGYEKWAMNSYFCRLNYSYNNKFLATITARADGSSRFGKNNKYGFFPSVGLGWVITNEKFLKNLSFLNYLKLRASYGITGNTELGAYRSLATINSGTILLNGKRANYSEITQLPNPNLEWEKTSQFDIGFNITMFNQRITSEFDYYHKLTSDLLLGRPIPHSTGFSSVIDNIGSVSNRGIDFLITTQNIQNNKFSWETTINLNFNKNRIEELGENDEDIFPGPWWVSGSQTILRIGEPLGSFWGYKRLGVWDTAEAAEAAAVGAIPGVAKRSDEREIIGKGIPDLTGSFINRLKYKNFDFMVNLQFSLGVEIMQQFIHSIEDRTGYANGLSTILYDGWTEANQNTMVQQIRNAPLNGQDTEVDDHWVVDGSYIRGSLFSLGYTFNKRLLKKTRLKSCRLFASVDNVFVIHSKEFKGYDPEATSWGDNHWGQNIFFFQYPKPTTVTFGINIKF
ncbi:MAG: TonB-dependent receptor [Draconibacterium sp.]|nr:TonB-dependent receptor [Draconibacterium sp.]